MPQSWGFKTYLSGLNGINLRSFSPFDMKKAPPSSQIKRAASLSFRGLKIPAIAQALNVSDRTILYWIKTEIWASEIKAWEDLERQDSYELARVSTDALIAELMHLRRGMLAGLHTQIQAGTSLGEAANAALEQAQEETDDAISALNKASEANVFYALQTSGQLLKNAHALLDQAYAIGHIHSLLAEDKVTLGDKTKTVPSVITESLFPGPPAKE